MGNEEWLGQMSFRMFATSQVTCFATDTQCGGVVYGFEILQLGRELLKTCHVGELG